MQLASYKGQGDIHAVVTKIVSGIENSALTAELLQKVSHTVGGHQVMLLGFEKFFYRSQNRGMLTMMITEDDYETITIDIISGGTSTGVFFKFDWGASKSFINTVDQILIDLNFTKSN